ncbi:zinc finger BED domain-containing protein DAYSLEEPER-like [Cynara cardunculus var. scolymus]|uniref:zinc finger BED domain-containing protein DAYSLEEPER-like n=1 Tax=Cynara cardunculus var. scolymus TaxID=59895 RepID=UPI000D62F1A4|nr:zinc finger BED domain-containing protein DAYSLEEPER-like [Cynara cardunculus var. scolymus]
MTSETNNNPKQSTPIGNANIQDNATINNVEEVVDTNAQQHPQNKRKGSVAWDHFVQMTVNGQVKAQCNHCRALLGGKSKNGTKHLLDHMKVCKAKNQPDIRQRLLASNLKSDLTTYVYNEKDGRNALAKMVILHEYPFAIVDHIGFKTFTRTIQPLFKCPSRNTLKNDIIKLYEQQKDQVIKDLENNGSRVAITTDMWTSSNQKKGFMAITTHFIDNEWILRSKNLKVIIFIL